MIEKKEVGEFFKRFAELEEIIGNFPKFKTDEFEKFGEFSDTIEKKVNDLSNDLLKYAERCEDLNVVEKLKNNFSFIVVEFNVKKMEEVYRNITAIIAQKMDEDEQIHASISNDLKEIQNIKNNLFSFFGLIVGLLAFIFVNYQFISSAKDLGMGKMLMFMGIANVGLILGIFLILGILGDLLGQPEKLKNSLKIMKSGWLFLGIISIIVLGFSIDLFDRSEKNLTIDKQIQEVQETQKRQYEELYNQLNKKDIENGKLKNEIDSLKNEIENLKNKK